jgi:hypothetical protein
MELPQRTPNYGVARSHRQDREIGRSEIVSHRTFTGVLIVALIGASMLAAHYVTGGYGMPSWASIRFPFAIGS